MLAIIKTGGKQYKVKEGDKLKIEKLDLNLDDKVSFDEVLLVSNLDGSNLKVGEPTISGVKVEAKIIRQDRYAKVNTVKYKNKTRFAKTKNHRQSFTEVFIEKIVA